MHAPSTNSLSVAQGHVKRKEWSEAEELYGDLWPRLEPQEKRKHVADFARVLRKLDKAGDGLSIFEGLYDGPPKSSWERKEYLWCLYKARVNVWDESPDIDAARTIIGLCSPRDKYSPYAHTSIRVAQYLLPQDYTESIEWLKRLRYQDLDDSLYQADNKKWHPSLRHRYLIILSRALRYSGDISGSIRCYIDAINSCRTGSAPKGMLWYEGPIWSLYEGLIRLSSGIQKKEGILHIIALLDKVGFKEGQIQSRYLRSLLGDSHTLEDWKPLWDRYGEGAAGKMIPDHAALRRVAEAVQSVEGELLFKTGSGIKYKPGPRKRVTATEIADFVFCPASLAIKQTFWTGTTESMEAGTRMHEEGLLDVQRRFKGIGGWTPAVKDPLSYLRGHLPPDSISENRDALTDIATARTFFSGHGKGKPKPFRNDSLDFEGIPDYVFERRDGKRFIVEEKFRSAPKGQQGMDKPFSSHFAQLASYIHYLTDFGADYGYLVYWYYAPSDSGATTSKQAKRTTLAGCSIYQIHTSDRMLKRLDEITGLVRSAKSGAPINFDCTDLNPSKCVKCSVVQFCNHKTGRFGEASIPYSLATGLGS